MIEEPKANTSTTHIIGVDWGGGGANKLTSSQYNALIEIRPALLTVEGFEVGLPYTVVLGETRIKLVFPTLDDGEHQALDRQIDSAAACLVLDLKDLASLFGITRDDTVS